jgi:hypothetical protein
MTARILNHHHDRLTRRSIFVGAAVSLLYAPAIVRATRRAQGWLAPEATW